MGCVYDVSSALSWKWEKTKYIMPALNVILYLITTTTNLYFISLKRSLSIFIVFRWCVWYMVAIEIDWMENSLVV